MDGRLVAAVATGMQGAAPGVKALHRFINYAIKLNDSSWSWEQHGVLLESDRKLLKASDGARAFSGEFISGDLLVSKSKDPISRSVRKLSRQMGVEIRGYVRYEIVDKNSRIGIGRFRDLTTILPFSKGVKPKVTAVDGSGERILTLASHHFASEIYLKPNDLIGANFSSLLNLTMENFESVAPEITEVISTFYPKARGKKWTGQKTESSSTGKQSTLF